MSNRYVWGRFSIEYEWGLQQNGEMFVYDYQNQYAAKSYTIGSDGKITLVDLINLFSAEPSTTTYPYCARIGSNLDAIGYAPPGNYWYRGDNHLLYRAADDPYGNNGKTPVKLESAQLPKPGTLQGYASAGASSAYPQDGVSGSYWYEYQGQDNIDARGCSIFSR